MVVGGSKIHERLAHFFIDIYTLKKDTAAENPLAYGKTEVQPLFEPLPTAISSIVFGNHVPCEHYGSTAKFGIQTRNPAKRLRV